LKTKKIRNKEVKAYNPHSAVGSYKIGDILYFEKVRDWANEGAILEGIYGEVVDIQQTRDNQQAIVVNFTEYRSYNETKADPGSQPRQFVVGAPLPAEEAPKKR
jgi:hypothetical protein